MGEAEGEPLSLNLFQDLIKEWDTDHVQNSYDPTDILHKMADILEKETNVYMASDPGDICQRNRQDQDTYEMFQILSRKDIHLEWTLTASLVSFSRHISRRRVLCRRFSTTT